MTLSKKSPLAKLSSVGGDQILGKVFNLASGRILVRLACAGDGHEIVVKLQSIQPHLMFAPVFEVFLRYISHADACSDEEKPLFFSGIVIAMPILVA